MRSIARRTAALVAVPALAVTGLVATSAPATAAPDPGPADAAAGWLVSQVVDGVVHDDQYDFDDIALSADFGFALQKAGGHQDTVDALTATVASRAHDEWYTYTDPTSGVTTLYAGSLAKTAAFAQAVGADATDFGGQDLVAMLEDTVSIVPPTTGRVQDENNAYGDTNMFGQAYAVQVLDAAGSTAAAPTLAYLLGQQCSEGWFRLDFSARDAVDQTCDGDASAKPDTDATAMALAAMMSLHDDALVPAIDKAEAWLLETQYKNGAWDGRQNSPEPNANSTGLVGSVLAELGDTAAASKAAAWVRAHQLTNVGDCTTYKAADVGAVAWNDADRKALAGGIDETTAYVARKATAGSLALLKLAETAGDAHVLTSPDYVQAGARSQVGVIDAAPGEALCVTVVPTGAATLGWANAKGEAHLGFKLPKKAGTVQVQVANAAGLIDEVELTSLSATKLPVSVKSTRIAGGKKQVVTVKGLAPGEMAQIEIGWPSKAGGGSGEAAGGQANRKGVFKVSFKVPHKPGTAKVTAQGQFKNRKGATSFTITR